MVEPERDFKLQIGSSKPCLHKPQASQSLRLKALMESPQIDQGRFSIQSLLWRIDDVQNRGHLETIYQLNRENELLREEIDQYKEFRVKTALFLQEAYGMVLFLQDALERYAHETAEAERDWLAFWGISTGLEDSLSTVTWI